MHLHSLGPVKLCYVMLWNELVLGAVMSQSNCKDT